MNAGKAVYGILSANSGVTDIVGTNIFPEIAEQETAVPFVVYQLQSVDPDDTHDGPSKLDEVRFEFLCYADSYNAAADLGVAVRAALDRVSGTYNGVHVESIQFNDVDVNIEYDPRRYSQVLTFTFRIKRDDVTIALGTPVTGAVLGDLSDVDVTGVTNGQLIAYNSTSGNWEPANDAGGANELSDLSDASVSLPSDGEVLIYSGGEFVNDNIAISNVTGLQAALDAAPDNLRELTDVTISGLADNDYLQYDSASGTWQNSTLIVGRNGEQYTGNYDSEAETLLDGATETVELYYTAQADGDGLHEDAQTDTATTGFDIRRKLYYAEKAQADPNTSGDWTQFADIADDTTYASAKATLLAYLKARTGGTVPISLKMTWEEVAEAPTFTGLLNESYGSGAAAAYGTRRLNGNYTGACMTIRRASDGTTTTIGFDGEDIDEAAITTFCTGTTCTVQVWHDQSQSGATGSGNDASQTTPANQPTIYTGGALVKDGGRLALQFDGSDDFLDSALTISTTNIAVSTVQKFENVAGGQVSTTISRKPNEQLYVLWNNTTGNWDLHYRGVTSTVSADTNQNIISFYTDTTNAQFYKNSASIGSSFTKGAISSLDPIRIGAFSTGSNETQVDYQELIIWQSDKSTNRTSIEGNVSGYYQSAKLLDEQYGENAAAAYSVRQLKRDNTDCMVIRRASDSTTTTIGFDSNGNIDEAAINTFCSGTTCTVQTWKDQSGNGNDATQATAANQPTIYTGSAIVKEAGQAAVSFDGASTYLTFSNFDFASGISAFNIYALNSSPATSDFWHSYFVKNTGGTNVFGLEFSGNTSYDTKGAILGNKAAPNDTVLVNTNQHLHTNIYDGAGTAATDVFMWEDGQSLSLTGVQNWNAIGGDSAIGWWTNGGASQYFDGKHQELIFYASDKSTDRTSIESNVGDYFTQNTPLLDTYTGAAAAYSLRKLSSSYSGSAIRVRRASDNAESDIGFNVFGELSTVELAAFCGSSDGFVKTWYSQVGTGVDATQTTAANQPKIYDGTTGVVTDNGKPAMDINSGDSFRVASITLNTYMTVCIVTNPDAAAGFLLEQSETSNSNDGFYFHASTGNTFNIRRSSNYKWNAASGWIGTNQNLATLISKATPELYQNGSAVSWSLISGSDLGDSSATDELNFFSRNQASLFYDGKFQEIVIFNSDQSSNRTNIEDNINTFYSIY
jgi:hypothetical protein